MIKLFLLGLCFPITLQGQISIGEHDDLAVSYKIVEEMPQFQDCGEIRVLSQSDCFQNYICTNLAYPPFAEKHGVKGEVIVYFEISETGKVENAKITQDIGAGCGTATLNFVNAMPDWIPGKERNTPVKVAYQLKVDYQPSSLDCR